MRKLSPHGFRRSAGACLVACLLLMSGCATTAQKSAPSSATAPAAGQPREAAAADAPKQCYNGCQQWGEACNVDPRGVYRCQRRCNKFGEICE